MNISPVSFSSTAAVQTSSFQDKISQPQAYIAKEKPSAAANLKGKDGKGNSPLKTLGKGILAAAVILAALGLGAKKGVFNPGKNETINKIKKPLETAGNFVADKFSTAVQFVKDKLHIGEAADDVAAATKEAADEAAAVVKEAADDVTAAAAETVDKIV